MNKKKVGVNGFGRIGKRFARLCADDGFRDSFSIAQINDPAGLEISADLFEHDSVHGVCSRTVATEPGVLRIGDNAIPFTEESDLEKLSWLVLAAVSPSGGREFASFSRDRFSPYVSVRI